MAYSESELIAAGYFKNHNGDWQRGWINDADTVFQIESPIGGELKRSSLDAGSKITAVSATLDAWHAGAAFPAPTSPQEVRGFHEQELSIQIGEALQEQKIQLEKLTQAQNNRTVAEVNLYKVNTKIPIDYAKAQLALQQATLNEMKANVDALKANRLVIEKDKIYNSSKIWWPTSTSEAAAGQVYVDGKQKEMDEIDQQIAGYQKIIDAINNNISQTNKDIQSINSGLIPDKYKYSQETQKTLDALKTVSDLYKNITEQAGTLAGNTAAKLAYLSEGKKIRNYEQAIAAWNKYQTKITQKFSAVDLKAIENSLKSLTLADIEAKLAIYKRGLGLTSFAIDGNNIRLEIQTSLQTGNWNNTFLKIETLLAGLLAGEVLALMFSFIALTPLTAASLVILLGIAGVLINDELMQDLNNFIDSL
ncbi:colicin-like pore-forming protein [Raoultella sp. Ech2A]|uniref:colicin-like pore-forming protein n=1 Tax=Raoultella sp. Ech2A TaxID=2996539 RepID=UPI0024BF7C40|nr:colicin-like pore-forming protein [Raoultella sp. Ech2A]MDJ1655321.1 colicin-like pore-forming protein [Raoultella sp. Ech2A]